MSLATYLDLLACPACKSRLEKVQEELLCAGCRARHTFVPGTDSPILLPASAAIGEPGHARAMKAHVHERFASINRTLSVRHGAFATFLNLGYVANGARQHAVRGPERAALNKYSTKLLFEVIGACNLDGRTTIELGSGRGGNLAMLQQYYRPRMLVGVDLSVANVAFCRERHAIDPGGFVVGDVEYLPIRDGAADTVLNLESSHYYPDIERFCDEVNRVLAPGGDFLYADILPPGTFATARRRLELAGLSLQHEEDISANVLLSCEAIGRLRQGQRYSELYETFDVVPGSPVFEALRSGDVRYKVFRFQKPGGSGEPL